MSRAILRRAAMRSHVHHWLPVEQSDDWGHRWTVPGLFRCECGETGHDASEERIAYLRRRWGR